MAECREAALSLAHAFAADDYAQYLVDTRDGVGHGNGNDVDDGGGLGGPDDVSAEDRWRLHVDIMTYAVAAHCLRGLVTTVGAECDAVALWLPPGKDLDGWWTLLRSGMWRLYFQLSPEGRRRYFDEILPLLHDTKAAVLGDRDADAWYLVFLGTKPNSQGRGYGRLLLEHMIERADAENRPIYLESSSLTNNAYYAKFGFEVKRDIFLKRGLAPVRLSIMVREPRASSTTSYACAAAAAADDAAAATANNSNDNPTLIKFRVGKGGAAGVGVGAGGTTVTSEG